MSLNIIFDMDGVLINTEKPTFEFYRKELKKQGIELEDQDFNMKFGKKSAEFFSLLSQKYPLIANIDTKALTNKKREAFLKNMEQHVELVKESKNVLAALKNSGFRMALASQNERPMIDQVLGRLGVAGIFEFTLSLQDIKKKKPDPEIYLLALKKMGVSMENTLVIEDSPDGVQAAKNAGLTVIGLAKYGNGSGIKNADKIISSLTEITPELAAQVLLTAGG